MRIGENQRRSVPGDGRLDEEPLALAGTPDMCQHSCGIQRKITNSCANYVFGLVYLYSTALKASYHIVSLKNETARRRLSTWCNQSKPKNVDTIGISA